MNKTYNKIYYLKKNNRLRNRSRYYHFLSGRKLSLTYMLLYVYYLAIVSRYEQPFYRLSFIFLYDISNKDMKISDILRLSSISPKTE